MTEMFKFLLGIIIAMFDAMPQEFTDATTGVKSKIPDENYYALITDGVMAMVLGAGFSVTGLTDVQLRGALRNFLPIVRAYLAAPRVVA
jgi:hypothetical protein